MEKQSKNKGIFTVPQEVSRVTETLKKAGFQAYLVGGCVRDLVLGKKPKDWDVTTSARPEDIISHFTETFYENNYGTVGVVNEIVPLNEKGDEDKTLKVVEVTPFRLEAKYSDRRRPDSVSFSDKLEDDLKRRDFTINALALDLEGGEKGIFAGNIIDLFDGTSDLKKRVVKTVGNPDDRFQEDALRILRAIRIAVDLDFTIEKETYRSLKDNALLLEHISTERIRDEFVKIMMSPYPMKGIEMAHDIGILRYIMPELEAGIGIDQTQAHAYDVWEHLLRSAQHAADKGWPLEIRLAALLHDISKPETRRRDAEKGEWTFYGHDVVGARVAKKILTRLNFPKATIELVSNLIRWHMFFTDTEQITLSAVRRMITNVGKEHIWELMDLRICDRVGTGRPKENPYRLRKYHSMIEEALRDPISVSMLKIDGNILMNELGVKAGPRIGYILHALLEEVLEDPKLNTPEYLNDMATKLNSLSEEELIKKGAAGKEKKAIAEQEDIEKIRNKHWVK